MKMKKLLLFASMLLVLASCTQNARVKQFGGAGSIQLDSGQKLEMVTWKDNQIWILTSERPDSIPPKSYKFFEKSSWGVLEGVYNIHEQ